MQIQKNHEISYLKIERILQITIPAQEAKITPPIGPALSQVKLKAKDFCAIYNENTKQYPTGFPLRVIIYIYKDKNYHFKIQTPTISFLLKNLKNFLKKKNLSLIDIYKIMLIKKMEVENISDRSLFRSVFSIAKLLGFKIEKKS